MTGLYSDEFRKKVMYGGLLCAFFLYISSYTIDYVIPSGSLNPFIANEYVKKKKLRDEQGDEHFKRFNFSPELADKNGDGKVSLGEAFDRFLELGVNENRIHVSDYGGKTKIFASIPQLEGRIISSP